MDDQTMLRWIYAGVLFLMGSVVGSFLNVIVYRAPLGMSLVEPPSTCPSCGNRIPARDNIPILGWLLLGGKCRACRNPISVRYPAVELATALLWAAVGWRLAGLRLGFWPDVATGFLHLLFVSAMAVTFLVDWDHRIILDEISLGGLAIGLAASPLLPNLHHAAGAADFAAHDPLLYLLLRDAEPWWRSLASSLAGAALGLAFSLFIYFAGSIAFRKQIEEARREDPDIDSALGLGDVKLMACFGAFLGWTGVLFIFVGGSSLCAIVGTVLKLASGTAEGATGWAGLRNRWHSGDSVLPFGPFLVAAALAVFFLGERLRLFF